MPGLPVPNAGADQLFAYSAVPFDVPLTGAGVDPDGFPILSWQWTLVYKPAGSAAFILNATTQNPTLKGVDLPGTYEPFLQVTSQNGSSQAATVPGLFSAVDTAFTHVVHRTQTQAWRVPAKYERNWTEYLNAILFALDTVAGGAAPASATYLVLSGPPANLPNAVNTSAIAAQILFKSSAGLGPAPVAIRSGAASTSILDLINNTGATVVQFRPEGHLLTVDDAQVAWPGFAITKHAGLGWWMVTDPAAPAAYKLAITPEGYGLLRGERWTVGANATIGAPTIPRLNLKGATNAVLSTLGIIYDPTTSRVSFETTDAPAPNIQWHFGRLGDTVDYEPELWLNGGAAAEARQVAIKWDAAVKRLLITSPNDKLDTFQIDTRIVLDVEDNIVAGKHILLDAAVVQRVVKTGANELQIGTQTAANLELLTDNTVWWRVLPTGELEADGAGGRIENLLAPIADGEAANKAYVDALGLATTTTTVDATPTVATQLAIAANSGERVEVTVSARQAGGSANRQWYSRVVDATRVGAGAILVNTTVTVPDGDVGAPPWTMGIAANGNAIEVTVTGAAATTIAWRVAVRRVAAV